MSFIKSNSYNFSAAYKHVRYRKAKKNIFVKVITTKNNNSVTGPYFNKQLPWCTTYSIIGPLNTPKSPVLVHSCTK